MDTIANIYVSSQEAGERVMESVTQFVESKLKLIIKKKQKSSLRSISNQILSLYHPKS